MFRISFEDGGLLQRLSAIQARAESIPQSTFENIGNILIASVKKNFDEGGRPQGWKPNLEGTKTLVKSGTLKNSGSISSVGNDHVEISWGGDLPYRFIHQFGGVVRAKNVPYLKFKVNGQWVSKKEVTIPARRYVRIQDEDAERIGIELGNFVIRGQEKFEVTS